MPASATVGISGAPLKRFPLVTASMRSLPARCNCTRLLDTDGDHHGDLAADKVVGRGCHAAIGNVDDIQCGGRLPPEHLAGEMIASADSGRAIRDLARIVVRVSSQLLQLPDRERGTHDESK